MSLLKLQKRYKNKKGFSMIELLVAVIIIVVIIFFGLPDYIMTIFNSKVTTAQSSIKIIGDATHKYYTEMGTLPPAETFDELIDVLENKDEEQDKGPWLKNITKRTDPWGNPYYYEVYSESDFDIISEGPPKEDTGGVNKEIRYTEIYNKPIKQ